MCRHSYLRQADATVLAHTDQGGVVLDQSLFYPTGGGQPGDSGRLVWPGGSCDIVTCIKGNADDLIAVPDPLQSLPKIGARVRMELDWSRRYANMRVHTALHLLSVAIPFGVTGGSIGVGQGRLDFDMAEPPGDQEAITAQLNAMIAGGAAVDEEWTSEEALDAQPGLIKTLSVQPPRGAGRIRLIRIGTH